MSGSKKSKYLTKNVRFGSQAVTLYSIDGLTWSTRRSELQAIKERIENQRVTLNVAKEEGAAPATPEAEATPAEDPLMEDDGPPVTPAADDDADTDDGPKAKKPSPRVVVDAKEATKATVAKKSVANISARKKAPAAPMRKPSNSAPKVRAAARPAKSVHAKSKVGKKKAA